MGVSIFWNSQEQVFSASGCIFLYKWDLLRRGGQKRYKIVCKIFIMCSEGGGLITFQMHTQVKVKINDNIYYRNKGRD